MTDTIIKLKRSSVPGRVPLPEDLDQGEIAINDYDGSMYYKKYDGTVGAFGTGNQQALIEQIANEKAIVMAIALG